MDAGRRRMIEQLALATAAALELVESLSTARPDTLDEVEEQDLRDMTALLARAAQLSTAMTGRISFQQPPEHLDRLARRHIESAHIAASRLALQSPMHAWAADTAQRLQEARLHIEMSRSEADRAEPRGAHRRHR